MKNHKEMVRLTIETQHGLKAKAASHAAYRGETLRTLVERAITKLLESEENQVTSNS